MKTSPATKPDAVSLATVIEAHGNPRKKRLRLIIAIVVLAAGGGWYWYSRSSQDGGLAPQYITAPVERGDVSLVITATGNLEPTNQVTVGSELSGTVQEVFVDINDHVKKGQPLAKLDTSKLTQQTESSRAALNSAKARVNLAQATLKESTASLGRAQELSRISGGKVPSKADLDTAVATADRSRADVENAEAAVDQAAAQLKANETDLGKAVIKSPIDGVVLTRSVEPGQTVAASFTAPELFILAEDLRQMKLKVAVAEADIGRLNPDQKATFTVDAWPDRSYTASVTRVSYGSAVTDNVVTYQTELNVANDDLSLRPGMTATADIHVTESKNVLLVPAAALRFHPPVPQTPGAGPGGPGGGGPGANGPPKKTFVQTLMPGPTRRRRQSRGDDQAPSRQQQPEHARVFILRNGTPEPITVKVGVSDGRRTEISGEGIAEGTPVITRAVTAPAS